MASWLIGVTIESMTGSPHGVAPGGSWPPPAGPPPTWPPTPPKQSRAPVIISLLVAAIAVFVAIASWFKPTDSPSSLTTEGAPQYTEQETANAKRAVCDAHAMVDKATAIAGGETSEDPVVGFVIAVNIRTTASLGAATYLRVLNENPATSEEVATPIRELASTYQELLLSQIGQAPKDDLGRYYDRINELDPKVVEACQ